VTNYLKQLWKIFGYKKKRKLIIKIKELHNMGLSVYTLALGLLGCLKEIIMGWSHNMDARKNKLTKETS